MNQITIVRETKKAYLLSIDGIEFWVQKRWYNTEKGRLTPKGLESYEEAKALQAADQQVFSKHLKVVRETEKAILFEGKFNIGVVEFWAPKRQVVEQEGVYGIKGRFLAEKMESFPTCVEVDATGCRETDKAYGFEVSVAECVSDQCVGRTMWFAKSQCTMMPGNILQIPVWLYQSALERVYESVKEGAWALCSNNVFEIGGLDRFSRQNVEIVA